MFGNYKRSDSHHTHLITTHEPACVFSCQCLRSRATTGLDALPPVALLSLAPSLRLSLLPSLPPSVPPSLPPSLFLSLLLSLSLSLSGSLYHSMAGWLDRFMDRWVAGLMAGWLGGWMNQSIHRCMGWMKIFHDSINRWPNQSICRWTRQGRLAGVGKRSTVACAAVALLPGAMSFVRAGLGGAGHSAQHTSRGFHQALARSPYGAANGKRPADKARLVGKR